MYDYSKVASHIVIDGRQISNNDPVYFIAEIGSNFDQDLSRAKDLIYLAKEAGAEAVKFQHYSAASLVSNHGFENLIQTNSSHQSKWKNSVYKTYDLASLNPDWTNDLKQTCNDAGITFLTSPYSMELVDYVDPYVPAYKIGSGDITWPNILEHIAKKNKPVILATGASTIEDVDRAMQVILNHNSNIILLQCNTNYTASSSNLSSINLKVLSTYKYRYPGIILGLSDHMQNNTIVISAVSLGARIIEKHFTDSTSRSGPDHSFAMDPESFREMVDITRELEIIIGHGEKKIEENERETVIVQRRSICASRPIAKGTKISKNDLIMLRPYPANSISPYEIEEVLGKTVTRDLEYGESFSWGILK